MHSFCFTFDLLHVGFLNSSLPIPVKIRNSKKVGHDVFDAFATHASLVYDIHKYVYKYVYMIIYPINDNTHASHGHTLATF